MQFLFIVIIALSLLTGCASTAERSIEQKIKSEAPVSNKSEMVSKGHRILFDNPKISNYQKKQLKKLFRKVIRKSHKVTRQIGRIKMVFFKELIADKANNEELEILKAKLAKLNNEKLEIMLNAMTEAREILGKQLDPKIFEDFQYEDDEGDLRM